MVPDPSSLSKLLVPESSTSNLDNLSCILVPDLSGTKNLDRIEHALLLPSFRYEILIPVTWTENFDRVSWALERSIIKPKYLRTACPQQHFVQLNSPSQLDATARNRPVTFCR